uniref:Integrase catalytic domain-containing protein n=1 Tax=Paramoeba aestuarina TaxID=180227 RepID=A0A7S4NGX2_9EUKA|mmetsp:Transcript_16615/g.25849  ORF Transcript_16615/g.25849 Transcript_16615/m.25849 type:complete len:218 (+) Transcript_16615:355-1008(+)
MNLASREFRSPKNCRMAKTEKQQRQQKGAREMLHIDILGPLIEWMGFKYVLVVVDAATRYIWLRPLKMSKAEEIADRLDQIAADFGWPTKYHSDGASELTGEVMKEINKLTGVEATTSVVGAHEQNAPVERAIREVRTIMGKHLELAPNLWPYLLQHIQVVMNNSQHSRFDSTPFELMFARPRGFSEWTPATNSINVPSTILCVFKVSRCLQTITRP